MGPVYSYLINFENFSFVAGPLIRTVLTFVGIAARFQLEGSQLKVISARMSSLHRE